MDINEFSEKKSYKTILITGGAGFLGRHLCKKLLENIDNNIICVDNMITGKESNIEEFKSNDRFEFINHDIIKEINFTNIDEIYNLASLASPDKYRKYPIETIMVNFIGTKNMLDLAKKHNAKILLTSTSEIYGDPLIHPQPEEYYGNVNTIGERSCYDESKRLAETIMYEYRKLYNLDTKIVRIFNTYGPYMDEKDGRVITNFIYKIKNNKSIEIYGDGNQTRSFCYVDDMIDGLIKMMNSIESGPINLGNPNCEFTLNELVHLLEKINNKKFDVKYLEKTENDPKCRKPIIDKAIEKLKWYPKINLEDGLKICIN
jgi:UDP-glucuronate decarboxylase